MNRIPPTRVAFAPRLLIRHWLVTGVQPLRRPLVRVLCLLLTGAIAALATVSAPVSAERLKDIASIQGVRTNQLLGYGLIVGLDGTGDQTTQAPFTAQSSRIAAVPARDPTAARHYAAAQELGGGHRHQLPAFAPSGPLLDVTVSSVGNAKSLRGGTLLLTPLRGADGQIYGMAQGNVVVGGAGASAAGSKVQINHLSAGRIHRARTVERVVPNDTLTGDSIRIELNQTDFGNVRRVADAINRRLAALGGADGRLARARDARVVEVPMPADPGQRVGFLAELETLDVTLTMASAKVIVNARPARS